MKKFQVNFQIGKSGLTEGIIENLKNCFKDRENVKIHILKSAGHDKEKIKDIAKEIIEKLGIKYTYKIVGFTIFVKKWRKVRR